MAFGGQPIIPVISDLKDVEKLLRTEYEYFALLDIHISRLKPIIDLAVKHQKKILLYLDLVKGLTADEYATEYICQQFKPFGIISTKPRVILKAKQNGMMTILRIFLLDTKSFVNSNKLIVQTKPDYIELLPGVVPKIIKKFSEETNREIIASGFIETKEEVKEAIAAGAINITTSSKDLWDEYKNIKEWEK